MSEKNEQDHDGTISDPELTNAEQQSEAVNAADANPADVNHLSVTGSDEEIARAMSSKSRRSFLVMGIAAAGGIAGWEWLKSRPEIDGIQSTLRRAHEFNEGITGRYFSEARLAPTFERAMAVEPRVNGEEGMADELDPQSWRLEVLGLAAPTKYPQYVKDVNYDVETDDSNAPNDSADNSDDSDDEADDGDDTGDNKSGSKNSSKNSSNSKSNSDGNNKDSKNATGGAVKQQSAGNTAANNSAAAEEDVPVEPGLLLTLADIKRLPRVEMTTQLKCIEGWSVIVNWAGARLSDFMEAYQPPTRNNTSPDVRNRPQDLVRYVSMETPDGEYYVGLDMASALHPQTILCYEMNGQALSLQHGAPLRLVTPVKYGIKHIKRIGRIAFTNTRPKDYWAERGYDWYSGH